jgi:hypothetical protein
MPVANAKKASRYIKIAYDEEAVRSGDHEELARVLRKIIVDVENAHRKLAFVININATELDEHTHV